MLLIVSHTADAEYTSGNAPLSVTDDAQPDVDEVEVLDEGPQGPPKDFHGSVSFTLVHEPMKILFGEVCR